MNAYIRLVYTIPKSYVRLETYKSNNTNQEFTRERRKSIDVYVLLNSIHMLMHISRTKYTAFNEKTLVFNY